MKHLKIFILFSFVLAFCLTLAGAGWSADRGIARDRGKTTSPPKGWRTTKYQEAAKKFEHLRPKLSSGAQNLWAIAEKGRKDIPKLPTVKTFPRNVNDRGLDPLQQHRFGGHVQSETSIAWGGAKVSVVYNDSGSFADSYLDYYGLGTGETGACEPGNGNFSFNGYSYSSDTGATFTDAGCIVNDVTPAGNDFWDLLGDPVVVTADGVDMAHSSLGTRFDFDATTPCKDDGSTFGVCTTLTAKRSTNSGVTWGAPSAAAEKDASTHFLDKEWLAVNPADETEMYMTYTDFDSTYLSVGCGAAPRAAIEMVASTDGGATWGSPIILDEGCGAEFVQGSQVIVDPYDGTQYAVWQHFDTDFFTRELRVVHISAGSIIEGPTAIPVTYTNTGFLMQGNFRSAFEFPSLAIDEGPGDVFVAWADSANDVHDPDAQAFFFITGSPTYNYSDILVAKHDCCTGLTFGAPVQVNDSTVEPFINGLSSDQYQPAIAVDPATGEIGVAWYDRRTAPENWVAQRYGAFSTNGGTSYSEVTNPNPVDDGLLQLGKWPSVSGQDIFVNPIYQGDYDQVTYDQTGINDGFFAVWSFNKRGDQNVRSNRFCSTCPAPLAP